MGILPAAAATAFFYFTYAVHPYPVWIGSLSVLLFIFYGHDKLTARKGGSRIPEMTLHILAVLGGFPGGIIGRHLFRHKIKKKSFAAVLLISALLHISIGALLLAGTVI